MKIVADQNIPCVAQAFADLGEVRLMPGREIKAQHLRDCQCLITRTVTRIDAALLGDSAVEFVGTATIGTDHIDLDYLRQAGIGCSNAPGCNAEGAAEYVLSGLFQMSRQRGFDPFQLKAGIIGFGNVGSRLVAKLEALGIDCLLCDPPLAAGGKSQRNFSSLDTLLRECNLISLHVPLTHGGEHPTWHLLDGERLRRLNEDCVLINAARGEVVDNRALLELLGERDDLRIFLDTWENEPLVSRDLLQRVDIATPHIAGYSVEGRLGGTQMVLDAACAHFKQTSSWHMSQQLPPLRSIDCGTNACNLAFWQDLLRRHCDIRRDHDAFVGGHDLDDDAFAAHFDGLRRVYPDRLEYPRFSLGIDTDTQLTDQLARLGFQLAQ
ncbi:MAG: 4-phosphoerythronate dehydrogenase [Gammaproteobacteria bacterium]|nr:4-phosphoerythronate dehydrogenase [Gammaproteobacteria bacterium]